MCYSSQVNWQRPKLWATLYSSYNSLQIILPRRVLLKVNCNIRHNNHSVSSSKFNMVNRKHQANTNMYASISKSSDELS